ncbi:ATP-binding protein [Pseudomonas kielensis]|nr:ATP-binding protein [Pseudomonas kielensis]
MSIDLVVLGITASWGTDQFSEIRKLPLSVTHKGCHAGCRLASTSREELLYLMPNGIAMQPNDQIPHNDVLDPAQLKRIESVHKGFLYQHLYAVGCLLLAQSSGVREVLVERDEDVELNTEAGHVYVQVKTRSKPIMPVDVSGALERFEILRQEHKDGRRPGAAQFVIVANQVLGETLRSEVDEQKASIDLIYLSAGSSALRPACLPPAWTSLEEAAQWCTAEAEKLNFSLLSPSSLTWKMAGLVMLACAAGGGNARHVFHTSELPGLFEQLVVQLQDFPTPPLSYRPQKNEPELTSAERVRIICGLSGAGKTTWAAHAALHSPEPCAYYDVGDLPGPALASSIVRELASKYMKRDSDGIRKILLPGASGYEAIRAFDRFLEQAEAPLIVVVDNAHRVPVTNIRDLLNATRHIRFILLCQPHENVRELEAVMGLRREILQGWDLDTVAQVASGAGAYGSPQALQQLRAYTGGLPLYVDSAIAIAKADYDGNIETLCADLALQANVAETAQEIILARVYEGYDAVTQNALAVVSLADTGLTQEEVVRLLQTTLKLSPGGAAAVIKKIQATGTVEVFGAKTLKVHDAVRALGLRHLELMGEPAVTAALLTLKELLIQGMEKNRDTSRIALLIQVFIKLNDVEPLIELAGEETFYEMGILVDVASSLASAVSSGSLDPGQTFWALDGLVFSLMRDSRYDEASSHLSTMAQILDAHGFEFREHLSLAMKKILFAAYLGHEKDVRREVESAAPKIPDSIHRRIFDYNHAFALWKLKRYKAAELLCKAVMDGYYGILGLEPKDVLGKNPDVLWKVIKRSDDVSEDIKHLADSLDLYAKILNAQGRKSGFSRIHAMKFYNMVNAYDSFVRLGQDAAEEFAEAGEYVGAREILEQQVLRVVSEMGLMGRMVQVRGQYAEILALCKDYAGAVSEIERLQHYLHGLEKDEAKELLNQIGNIVGIMRKGIHG